MHKAILALLLTALLVLVLPALAQTVPSIDPFYMGDLYIPNSPPGAPGFPGTGGGGAAPAYAVSNAQGYQQTATKSDVVVTSIHPTNDVVIFVAGEGNSGTMTPNPYVPTHPTRVFNLNVYAGAAYVGTDPWLGPSALCYQDGDKTFGFAGCNTGGWVGQLADAIVGDAVISGNVYMVPLSIYLSNANDWYQNALASRLPIAIKRVVDRYPSTPLHMYLLWGGGEADLGLSTSDYQTRLQGVIDNARAQLPGGWTLTVFVAKQTWRNGVVNGNVQAAQVAICDNNPAGADIWLGPDADAIGTAFRQALAPVPNTYWSGSGVNNGVTAYVNAWMTVLRAYGGPF